MSTILNILQWFKNMKLKFVLSAVLLCILLLTVFFKYHEAKAFIKNDMAIILSSVKMPVNGSHSASNSLLIPNRRSIATGPLRVSSANPNYFEDGSGNIVYLTGSHFWLNLQDVSFTDPPPPNYAFNYGAWLDFLVANNHNFFRLWTWEEAKWVTESSAAYYFSPLPYQRTGPGNGLDGKPKFDVTKFNQAYFDRLRQRVIQARDRGIYVSIMLFNGWSVSFPKGFYGKGNPWLGHPYNKSNNINGIDGDPNQNDSGDEINTLTIASVTNLQDAYVQKVVDTVHDLDNVLYEISNETNTGAESWQYHMIDLIKVYETQKSYPHHPVGMTVEWPNGWNGDLYASNADWISPNGSLDQIPAADGRKVVVADTDHLCGICGDRGWVWKSFTSGQNPLFMDQYDDSYKLEGGGYNKNNPTDVSLRKNLGYTLSFANCMNMAKMKPHGELAEFGYALANPAATAAEYLVYFPFEGSRWVNLSASPVSLNSAWLNPEDGTIYNGPTFLGGNNRQTFSPPFSGDSVLYLYQNNNPPPDPSFHYKYFIPIVHSIASSTLTSKCFK